MSYAEKIKFKLFGQGADWFNVLRLSQSQVDVGRDTNTTNTPFVFADRICYDYLKLTVAYEMNRFAIRVKEEEKSCAYFRATLSGFVCWHSLMQSKLHSGEASKITSVGSLVSLGYMSKGTAQNHLKAAVDAGWAVKFAPTDACNVHHYEASDLCMVEYLQRLRKECHCYDSNHENSYRAFNNLMSYVEEQEGS